VPYRFEPIITGGFYHVFNRGAERKKIFIVGRDYDRFLRTLRYYNKSEKKVRYSRFNPSIHKYDDTEKMVNIIAYCLMPNHFHLLLRQVQDNAISKLIGQVCNSYTKYFNIKRKRFGRLFHGNFKAVRIENDSQLLHVSRYIHLNPFVAKIVKEPKNYQFSSYREYINSDLKQICDGKDYILSHFRREGAYADFVSDHMEYAESLAAIKHLFIEE